MTVFTKAGLEEFSRLRRLSELAPDMTLLLRRADYAFDSLADAGYMNEPKRILWRDIRNMLEKVDEIERAAN